MFFIFIVDDVPKVLAVKVNHAKKAKSHDLKVKHTSSTGVVLHGVVTSTGTTGVNIEPNSDEDDDEDFNLSDSD